MTSKPISTLLAVFCLIRLSSCNSVASPTICSANESVSISQYASRKRKLFVERQNQALVASHLNRNNVKSFNDSIEDSPADQDEWHGLHTIFPFLERLVGSQATMFARTSTFESNVSARKLGKDKNVIFMRATSLEDIHHTKQYWCMRSFGIYFRSESC